MFIICYSLSWEEFKHMLLPSIFLVLYSGHFRVHRLYIRPARSGQAKPQLSRVQELETWRGHGPWSTISGRTWPQMTVHVYTVYVYIYIYMSRDPHPPPTQPDGSPPPPVAGEGVFSQQPASNVQGTAWAALVSIHRNHGVCSLYSAYSAYIYIYR